VKKNIYSLLCFLVFFSTGSFGQTVAKKEIHNQQEAIFLKSKPSSQKAKVPVHSKHSLTNQKKAMAIEEKKASIEKSEKDLLNVRESIQKVESKIDALEQRGHAYPDDSNPIQANKTLLSLKEQKRKLRNIEFSILSHLKIKHNQIAPSIVILKSDFEKLPQKKQAQILARPERYTIKNK
tara:strand:+ start:1292 stop:1831 length:540 start_codon:yes stop_codon:yes gene_type:complete